MVPRANPRKLKGLNLPHRRREVKFNTDLSRDEVKKESSNLGPNRCAPPTAKIMFASLPV